MSAEPRNCVATVRERDDGYRPHACGRPAVHEVTSGRIGESDWPVCAEHSEEYVDSFGWEVTGYLA